VNIALERANWCFIYLL